MKNDWIITFRSVTYAQKGESVLQDAGIRCRLQRTPKELSQRGCGYCLRLRGSDAVAAVQLLQDKDVAYERTYALPDGGRPEAREI